MMHCRLPHRFLDLRTTALAAWVRLAAILFVLVATAMGLVPSVHAEATAATAAPRVGLLAGPEQLVLGAERTGSFAVCNVGDAVENITITPSTEAASWVELDNTSFTLAAAETRHVAVQVRVPDGATPGDHLLKLEVAATLAVPTASAISSRVVSPVTVVVRIPGAIVRDIGASLSLPGFLVTTTGEVTVKPRIENNGNVLARWQASGTAVSAAEVPALQLSAPAWLPQWLGGGTRLLASGFSNDAGGFQPAPVSVLPGDQVEQLIVLRDLPLLGWYDYRYTLPGTDSDAPVVIATGPLVVLNLLALARVTAGLVVLALVGLAGMKIRRRPDRPVPARALPPQSSRSAGRWASLPAQLHRVLSISIAFAVVIVSLGLTPDLARAESPSPAAAESSAAVATADASPIQTIATPTLEATSSSPSPTASELPSQSAVPEPVVPEPSEVATPVPTERIIVRFTSSATQADRDAAMARYGGQLGADIDPLHLRVVAVPADRVDAVLDAYGADPLVTGAERDSIRSASGAVNDPEYAQQWNLPQIGWEAARAVTPATGVQLAVLDTGIAANHPDLTGRVIAGWSAIGGDPYTDPNGHGTAMAGIAAALTDNGQGIAGVAPTGVSLLSVQVLGADGTGSDSDIITGLLWAVEQGADVALLAFANSGSSAALQDAIDYAWAQGVVLVAAVGNDGSAATTYPAGAAHVVGVAATDSSDALAPSSNFGAAAFLAAPGVGIPALTTDGGTSAVTGTSASAAQVAGAAALLRAIRPQDSNGVIVGRLARTAAPAGTSDQTGNGRLDLGRAVGDESTAAVDPVGVPGGGGPVVGPYRAALTCTAVASGNWNASATWSGCGGSHPIAGDTVLLTGSFTVTVPAGFAAAAGSITIGTDNKNDANVPSLVLADSTSALTVDGGVMIYAADNGTRLLNVAAGTLTTGHRQCVPEGARHRNEPEPR